jgi:DNA polymerase-1
MDTFNIPTPQMRDKCLKEAVETGKDFYSLMAVDIWEIPYEEVTKKLRSKAKTVSFHTVYGSTSESIQTILKV